METDDTKRKVVRALGSSTVATWFWMCGCWTTQIQTVNNYRIERDYSLNLVPACSWESCERCIGCLLTLSLQSQSPQAFDKFAAKEAVERVPLYHGCSARFLEARVKPRGGWQCWRPSESLQAVAPKLHSELVEAGNDIMGGG